MRILITLALVTLAAAGCATTGPLASSASMSDEPAPASMTPSNNGAPSMPDMSPRLIMPVTGGAPVIGVPLAGDIYQPVTGGPPVIATPLFP